MQYTMTCKNCLEQISISRKQYKDIQNPNANSKGKFCSRKCTAMFSSKKQIYHCELCNEAFTRKLSQIQKSPRNFCSRSCAATYNNKNKKHGTSRSKLEVWLEEQLVILYPNLEIHFNRKNAVGSELDIYFPLLKLAFELNGIFHYEPIFGESKHNQITSNDVSKSKACLDAQIDLCVIDTSGQKYFKPKTSQKYLDIITSIVNKRRGK